MAHHEFLGSKMPDKNIETITGYNWGDRPMEIHVDSFVSELRPIEIHCNEAGSTKDNPTFAILMVGPDPLLGKSYRYGQMSLEMFSKALNECGYTIIKKP